MDSRQLDDGVTTVHDVSQITTRPQHSDAAIQALIDTGRRAAFGYFESAGNFGAGVPGNLYPLDATRIYNQWFAPNNLSKNGLVHMIMGGEVYLGDATTDKSWTIGRSSVSRLRRTSSRHSASPRPWTSSPRALAASAKSGSGPTTCSST